MTAIVGVIAAGGGRFVPPFAMARTGLGLSAGQFKITDATYNSGYTYNLTGASISRSGQIVSLSSASDTGTVQAAAPKGVLSSSVVNVARTPYTYHASYHHNPKCASNWHSGQCAAWGPPNTHFNGNVKNGAPANYNDSEGEWWRIW